MGFVGPIETTQAQNFPPDGPLLVQAKSHRWFLKFQFLYILVIKKKKSILTHELYKIYLL